MGLITRITERAADAVMARSPAYRAVETKLREATEILSIYNILDPRYWYAVGSSQRDMPANVRDTISRQVWTIYQTNPTAANYVNAVSAYLIGPGFQIKHPDPDADEVVQEYIAADKFMATANVAVNQYLLTAEVPALIFVNVLTGEVKVRLVDPLEIYDVAYDPDDNQTVVALWRRYTRREAVLSAKSWAWVETSVEDVITQDEKRPEEWGAYTRRGFVFWKRPTIPAATRGVSFLTPALKWMTQYERIIEARVALNRARATYARDLELGAGPDGKGATQEECDAMQAKLNAQGESRPAAWFVHGPGAKLTFPGPNVGAGDAKDDLRAVILMAVAGLGIPEFIGTGDASNANYASTSNVAASFVKAIQKRQFEKTTGFIQPVFDVVLNAAADARRISPEAAVTPVEVTYPQIQGDALADLTAFITAGLAQGFLDKETAADLAPFELTWDTIKARLAVERAERVKDAGGIPDIHTVPPQPPVSGQFAPDQPGPQPPTATPPMPEPTK